MSWVVILLLMQSLKAQLIPFSIYQIDDKLVLIGDESSIYRKLNEMQIEPSLFEIVHTTQVIEMADHPAKAFSQKKDSSIAVGYGMLKSGAH